MKLAVISDIHANLEALTAVFNDIESHKAEKIFFLGDAVGYGADPNKCVKLVNKYCDIKLLGNHDYVALGLESPAGFNPMAKESILWTQEKISRKSIEIMADFDMEASYLDCFMVHATPEAPAQWNYLLTTYDAQTSFEAFSQQICFIGHSHIPVVFCMNPDGAMTVADAANKFNIEKDCRYIINVGSVGQPRDGNAAASYVLYDTEEKNVEICRVSYDLQKAQGKMRKAQLPEFLADRLENGK